MPKMKFYNGTSWITLDANDADTVDGKHAADFALATHNHDTVYYTQTQVNNLLAGKLSTTGKAADSNLLDGLDSTAFATASHTHTEYASSTHNHSGTYVNLAGDTMTGALTFNTATGEKQVKASDNHGMFLNTSGLGFYDWTNARTIFSYNKSANTITIGSGQVTVPKTVVSANGSSLTMTPHSAGVDIHSTGNIAPHYQSTFSLYTGAIGSGVERFRVDNAGKAVAYGGLLGHKTGGAADSNLYANSQVEARSTAGDVASIGFHRTGLSAVALYHDGTSDTSPLKFITNTNRQGTLWNNLNDWDFVKARQDLPSTEDINLLANPGVYRIYDNGSLHGSWPAGVYRYGTLIVSGIGNSTTQCYHRHDNGYMYTRTKWNASDWSAWRLLHVSGDWVTTDRVRGNSNRNVVWIGDEASWGYFDVNTNAIRMQYDNGTYLKVGLASIDMYFGGTVRHAFFSDGRKTGGSIDIDGHTYGMSPVDSPRTMIDDLITDIQLTQEGVKVFLDEKLSKAFDRYSIFPNNPTAVVTEKTATYFVVKGEGIVDFIIRGIRLGTDGHYWNDMEHASFDDTRPAVVSPTEPSSEVTV